MMSRIEQLDKAKGIGMILVIYGHLFRYGGIPFSLIFAFHMPLFFYLSGYFFKMPDESIRIYSWLKGVIKRYLMPLFFFSLIGGIIRFMFVGSPNWKNVANDFWHHMSSDEFFTGSVWFLWMLAVVHFLLLYIVKWGGQIFNRRLIIIISLSIISYLLSKVTFSLPFLLKSVSSSLLFVYLGYITRDLVVSWTYNKRYSNYCLMALPLFVLLVLLNKTVNIAGPVYNDFFIFLLCAFYGIFLVLLLSKYPMPSFVSYIGRHSLIVFSLHAIYIVICVKILNLLLGTEYGAMVNIPIFYVIVVGIGVVILSIIGTVVVLPVYNAFKRLIA